MSEQNRLELKIEGTHCAACEVLIERKLKKISGVTEVKVDYPTGKAIVQGQIDNGRLSEFNQTLNADGYNVRLWSDRHLSQPAEKDYRFIGVVILFLLLGYLILQRFNLLPAGLALANFSYGAVFVMGLVAAISTCMATTGGLLIAVSTRYNQKHSGQSSLQKVRPHLFFNLGRVIGYGVFGALVGLLGSALSVNPVINGLITIIASIVMVLLGLQLLEIFPAMQKVQFKLLKSLAHKVYQWSESDQGAGPMILGALTFFLPCGFTQALQLYVLSQGQPWQGGLLMMVFALGTIPALMSIGLLASFISGVWRQRFVTIAGVLVLVIGLWSVQNGVRLLGWNQLFSSFRTAGQIEQEQQPTVPVVNGRQVIKMSISGFNYQPAQFTVRKGIPVDWQINASQAAGCMTSLIAPQLGLREFLSADGVKTVTFTPTKTGTFGFSCAMGMGTRGAAIVVVD